MRKIGRFRKGSEPGSKVITRKETYKQKSTLESKEEITRRERPPLPGRGGERGTKQRGGSTAVSGEKRFEKKKALILERGRLCKNKGGGLGVPQGGREKKKGQSKTGRKKNRAELVVGGGKEGRGFSRGWERGKKNRSGMGAGKGGIVEKTSQCARRGPRRETGSRSMGKGRGGKTRKGGRGVKLVVGWVRGERGRAGRTCGRAQKPGYFTVKRLNSSEKRGRYGRQGEVGRKRECRLRRRKGAIRPRLKSVP